MNLKEIYKRRGRNEIGNNIGKEDWKKHFVKLLNGAEIKEREEPGRKDETIKEGRKEDRRYGGKMIWSL